MHQLMIYLCITVKGMCAFLYGTANHTLRLLRFPLYVCSMTTEELFQTLKQRMDELQISQADLNRRAFGKPKDSSFQNIKRGFPPAFDTIEAIAKALELEVYVGPKRADAVLETELDDQFARIPLEEHKLSAGPGYIPSNNLPDAEIAFRRDWLRKRGLNPVHCSTMEVRGESMAPTLSDGDLVLIDCSQREIVDRKLYAIADGDEGLKAKRLIKSIGSLVIVSDNHDYPIETRVEEDMNTVRIIGRIVWSGHRHDG